MSSRQLHHEPEVVRHAAPPDDVEFMNHAQHDSREAAPPSFSTIDALQRWAGNDSNPKFSTIGAPQRGAEVGVNPQKDPALAVRTEANPTISTLVAHDVGPENGICGLSSDRVVTPKSSTIDALQPGADVKAKYSEEVPRDKREALTPKNST